MRIAISGAHRTGKSTLLEALEHALPGYVTIREPYQLMEEEGHEFNEVPSLDDFELQLSRSVELVTSEDGRNRIFDRCPADFLAYLATHEDADGFDAASLVESVGEAMSNLELIVFVGIERPDRIAVDAKQRRWRRRVDEELREIIVGDRWDWRVPTIEVAGDVADRVRQVVDEVARPRR